MILTVVIGYLCIGCLAALIGPAAKDIHEEYQDVAGDHPIKARLYVAVLVLAMAVLWPIMLPSAAKTVARRKERESSNLFALMGALTANGTDHDTIPGATGEFGCTVTNPIPTCTPLGSKAYLDRLRTVGGQEISWSRRGSTLVDGNPKPVDMYDVRTRDGQRATLYVSPYHKRNSGLAPKGFRLADNPPAERPPDSVPLVAASPNEQTSPIPIVKSAAHMESRQSATLAKPFSPAMEQLQLGLRRLNGIKGSPKNPQAAEYSLRLAAEGGLDVALLSRCFVLVRSVRR